MRWESEGKLRRLGAVRQEKGRRGKTDKKRYTLMVGFKNRPVRS